jgi:hypothetical protein
MYTMLVGQFYADSMTLPNYYYKELPAPVHYQGDDDGDQSVSIFKIGEY